MEGQETYRYRFMKSLIQEDIQFFRAKHVKNWLGRIKYDRKVYDAQVYNSIINPLIKQGFIRKEPDGYYVEDDVVAKLDTLLRHKSGPKPIEDPLKIPPPFKLDDEALARVTEMDLDSPEEDDNDAWNKYIARKLKEDIGGKV